MSTILEISIHSAEQAHSFCLIALGWYGGGGYKYCHIFQFIFCSLFKTMSVTLLRFRGENVCPVTISSAE